jgi:hypothetical protein
VSPLSDARFLSLCSRNGAQCKQVATNAFLSLPLAVPRELRNQLVRLFGCAHACVKPRSAACVGSAPVPLSLSLLFSSLSLSSLLSLLFSSLSLLFSLSSLLFSLSSLHFSSLLSLSISLYLSLYLSLSLLTLSLSLFRTISDKSLPFNLTRLSAPPCRLPVSCAVRLARHW